MKEQSSSSNKTHYCLVRATVNTSNRQLSASEESVLNKGLKFATTIRHVPYLDVVTLVEEAALKISKVQADELKSKMRQALEKDKLNTKKKGRQSSPYRMTLVSSHCWLTKKSRNWQAELGMVAIAR